MIYLFSFLSYFFPQEINIANSIDWLCYDSDIVVIVNVDSVVIQENTLIATVTIVETYKGKKRVNEKIKIYSRLEYIGGEKVMNLNGKKVLAFLSFAEGAEENSYLIKDEDRGLMNIDSPGSKALTGDFKYLKNKDEITNYITNCIKNLNGKKAQPYFLEVPFVSEAHQALYSGSSCYLIVPDVLYPNAKKTMH